MANNDEIVLYTKEGLAELTNALSKGVLKFRLNNREVQYQSVNQLIKARDDYAAKLAVCDEQSGKRKRRPRAFRGRCTNKGY